MSDGSDLEFDNGNDDFRDAHEPLNPQEHDEIHEENHFGYYKNEDGENDLDMSFERDPDTLMKVKAKIMFNINKERRFNEIPIMN